VAISEADRAELQTGLRDLSRALDGLRRYALNRGLDPSAYVVDVELFHKAVRYALDYNEFFVAADPGRARMLLATALERAWQLERGDRGWLARPGPTVLGYVSRIDGSVQPYGLYIPESYARVGPYRHRLDAWFHGRGENLGEVAFIDGVLKGGGQFVRPDTFVLQPYGRYCNANKFAGEVDLLEALADVERRFRIDPDRIAVRGFSMGGAAAWQFAAHYASRWAAAAPGAGFAESALFLKIGEAELSAMPSWERKLWQLYDCPDYAGNFLNLPVVAYSGENDAQRQAAEVMARALAREGIELAHVIGPKTEHRYHPDSIPEINRRVDGVMAAGRTRVPRRVRLETPTLKYDRQAWVRVAALGEHWVKARVEAEIAGESSVSVKTQNVAGLVLEIQPGESPFAPGSPVSVTIDGGRLEGPRPASDRSWRVELEKEAGAWRRAEGNGGESGANGSLRKRHDLQGPIDDAFMESFLVVRPTGSRADGAAARWVESELARALVEWRRQFRGDARVKNDTEVTDADIAAHNLVLWGDPTSNRILARIADRLPIRWTAAGVTAGADRYDAATHVPVLVYPNPLNGARYVVCNSGFTFREYDYLNNARQVPRLPDWAIIDTTVPPGPRAPGRIAAAGFFDEQWRLRPAGR
jgi:pimeloyl-ACP methyl ester carboxylesterase